MRHSPLRHCLLLPLLIASCLTASAGTDSRPNVILIMADDIGYECFGCYGSRQYSTPNIDRMAAQGIRFDHCYSQPLCTPSRVKLMTGLSNVRNYAAFSVLRKDQKTIGQYFREAGYRTAIAGKWQLLGAEHYAEQFRGKGTWPQDAGFENICLWQVDRLGERFQSPLMWIDGTNTQFDKSHYGPDVATDYLVRFIEQHHDTPFFAYYPMILVHNPFVPTPDSESAESKNRQQNFEDMVVYMDKLVGRLVDATEKHGIAENTLILFIGDNGTNTSITSTLHGVEIKGGKGRTTDAGTRVPCIALWPGTSPQARVCSDLVDFSDFLPTVLSACGIDVPAGLDGQSFLPQLQGKKGTPREWISCYYNPRPERSQPRHFVRDQVWKLYDDGQLFNITTDVLEKQPVLPDADHSPDAARARTKLQKALSSLPQQGQVLLDFDTPSRQ